MKKILVVILLTFLPVVAFSQWSRWSIVGSVAAGISEVDNAYMTYYKDSKGKMGIDMALTARYSVWRIYLSSGVGYQSFKSQSGYELTSSTVKYNGVQPEFSYSNIYVPVTVGFNHYKWWKLYPVVEMGATINFPVELKDRLEIGNEVTTRRGDSKGTVVSFVAQGGLGYSFNDRCSVEAKFRFSTSGSVSTYKDISGKDYNSTWQFIGGQLSLVINL